MSMRLLELEELTTPRDGYQAVVNRWWLQNPEGKILDWVVGKHRFMQANRDQKVAQYLVERNSHYAGCTPILIPLAFYPFQE